MMKGFPRSRAVVALGVVVGMLALAGGAFAYFTSSGTGTGSATVGSSTPFTVTSAAASGPALVPDTAIGGANVDSISYSVKNPSTGSQNLSQVVVSIATSTGGAWSSQTNSSYPACTAADFSVDGAPVGTAKTDTSLAGDMAAGTTKTGTATVELIDSGKNQDNCEGVTVPLYFSAS